MSPNGLGMNVADIPAAAAMSRIASLNRMCRSAISNARWYSRLISHWPRPHSTWLVHGPRSEADNASRTPAKNASC